MSSSSTPSYWTLRRKAKRRVDSDLQSLPGTVWGGIELAEDDTDHNAMDFLDCSSTVSDTESFFDCDDLSDTESESEEDDLLDELSKWAAEHRITHNAINSLLSVLGKHHPSLPKDARTLLGTARSTSLKVCHRAGGQYYYFGVMESISDILHQHQHTLATLPELQLQVNIDGLPLFKSSGAQLWPILGTVLNLPKTDPVTIGLYCGSSKPNSLEEFLGDFVDEICQLQDGFVFEGHQLKLKLFSLVCDAPARAFVKAVKGHTGYHGCEKCTQEGAYVEHRMTFPRADMPLRSDEGFRERADADHHHATSPLERTGLGMVSGFPLDYMHLVCLGVVRRLLLLWLRFGPVLCRLSGSQVTCLSERLVALQSHVPSEFARRPRRLQDIDRWKATEFRQFLLYTGPAVLKDIVCTQVYNFLLLFVGIFILSDASLTGHYTDFANDILCLFVSHFNELYGAKFLTYNVHNVTHLAQDVKMHGTLDRFSAFQYENHLGKIKRLIRKPGRPISQIIKRLSESPFQGHKCKTTKLSKEHGSGPVPPNFEYATQFKTIQAPAFTLKTDEANSYFYLEGKVKRVKNILHLNNTVFVAYTEFEEHKPFFDYPLSSSLLNIYEVCRMSETTKTCKLEDIDRKAFVIPIGRTFVTIPLLHGKDV
ncbi:hypothetical protein N1851_015976 [Merluccius polli]|uniref:Transposase domain-containing protein n=1 Tax=Merluccius polli TaxID=89951 RepID=A0AA47MR92_MERPO|nr:hypothetical protein N1851_015976 [Merluccius polli]